MKKNLNWIIEILILLLTLIIVLLMIIIGKLGLFGFVITSLILYLLNVIISIYIFANDRNFETKISWLLFIIIVPIIGHVFFIFLGRKNTTKYSKIEYEKTFNEFANTNLIVDDISAPPLEVMKKISALSKRNWKQANFEIYQHCFHAYEKLFEDISNAKHHIHIEMYIMKPSEIYDQFKSLLFQKVKDGVEVRMIIDDFGKWSFNDNEMNEMERHGIQIELFNKITFPFINIKQSFRLHRKMIIIDGIIVHTGGMNISDEYSSFSKKYGYWVDINTRIQGDICNDFSQLFLLDWFNIKNEKLSTIKYIIQQKNQVNNTNSLLLEEGPNIGQYILEKTLMHCISFATKKIRIATPYFVPSKKILDQLKFALLEGVEIEIFIPGIADKKYVLEATHFYLKDLILSGAKVYELNNMFLHSKIGTFDNSYGYLGSINWDMRTLYSNYESINFLFGESINKIDEIFDDYKKYSKLIVLDNKRRKTILGFFKILLIKSLSPLM